MAIQADARWQPEDLPALCEVIQRLERELPGWWWSVGACHVSADASVGPIPRSWAHASIGVDSVGPAAHLLEDRTFDEGFHCDLRQPATCAQALNVAIDMALSALSEGKLNISNEPERTAVSLNSDNTTSSKQSGGQG